MTSFPGVISLCLEYHRPDTPQRWNCALIFKRNAVRSSALNRQDWTEEEDNLLREIYPAGKKLDIFQALPTKSGWAVRARASGLGVQRDTSLPVDRSALNPGLCCNDWASSCAALKADIAGDEGQKVLKMLNYYARTSEKKRAAFWWVLPVAEMNALDGDLSWCECAEPSWW